MTPRPALTPDELVADVVLRRFASATAGAVVTGVVHDLARAVYEDHVALDLDARRADAATDDTDVVLVALTREPGLCEFLAASEEPERVGPPLVVVDRRFVYLRRLAVAEYRVAATLARARAATLGLPGAVADRAFDEAVATMGAKLVASATPSPELGEVARRCLSRRVSFVVGGPGTGKTWLVTQILRLLDRALGADPPARPLTFVVAAPTGKAARRVGETIDQVLAGEGFAHLVRDREREGSLHRLLNVHPSRSAEARALHHDVVIVDEVSMADLSMLDLLLRSTAGDDGHQPRVILVGDAHQLASVNVGAVLADAVNPEALDDALVSRLVTVRRTGRRALLDLAAAVNDGDASSAARLLAGGGGVEHVGDVQDPATVRRVVEHAAALGALAAAGEGTAALAALGRLCVLAANLEGPGSVAWWNARVGAAHRRRFAPAPGERFCVGEPVLVTRNQPALNLSNGDLGVVVERDARRVIVFEGDRVMPVGAVGFLQSAWAMTIHKSQGSEFDHVVVTLPRAPSPLLTRELLYTAVTRAREGVTVLAEPGAVERAVSTAVSRVSGLTHRLATWGEPAPATSP